MSFAIATACIVSSCVRMDARMDARMGARMGACPCHPWLQVVVEVQENATDKLIRQLKEENEKMKKLMESMGGNGLDPVALAAMASGSNSNDVSAEAPPGIIGEDRMQLAIEKVIDELKGPSAAEKKAALDALKAGMLARHEGVMHSHLLPAHESRSRE